MTKLFINYNMGRSAGLWLEWAWNSHPDIWALHTDIPLGYKPEDWPTYTEPTDILAFVDLDTWSRLDYSERERYIFEHIRQEFESGKWAAVGVVVHGFEPGDIVQLCAGLCISNDGLFTQSLRNPIAVVGHRIKDDLDDWPTFKRRMYFYAQQYKTYIARAANWPLIKIETLDASLEGDGTYFAHAMERITGVSWSPEQVDHVRQNVRPNKKRFVSWTDDPEPAIRWESWGDDHRALFLEYFIDIMLTLGYSWPASCS